MTEQAPDFIGCTIGQPASPAQETQPVATFGLLHVMSRHEQRLASRCKVIEHVPQFLARDRVDWTGPFVEVRISQDFNGTWFGSLRADFGGFGISSDPMYNVALVTGYRFNENIDFKFGYCYLYADFEKDRFNYNVSLSGFGLGPGIRF